MDNLDNKLRKLLSEYLRQDNPDRELAQFVLMQLDRFDKVSSYIECPVEISNIGLSS